MLGAYEDHRSAGAFLFRELEDVAETYPSLVSAARRSPSPRATGSESGGSAAPSGWAADGAEAVEG